MAEKQRFLWHEVQGVEATKFGQLAKQAEQEYGDLLRMKHPRSERHTPLSAESRAAQFAPFAALTGYDDAVEETARYTDGRIEIDEQKREEMDAVLQAAMEHPGKDTRLLVTWFSADERKEGGSFQTQEMTFRRVDPLRRVLESAEGHCILLDEIVNLEKIEEGTVQGLL